MPADRPIRPSHNWAGNHQYRAAEVIAVSSVEQLQQLVAGSRRVHALGSRHTFNAIGDTDGALLDLSGLDLTHRAPSTPAARITIDEQRRTVTVAPAVRHAALADTLAAAGWALGNLASLPHISTAGAVATGTHGSGDANQNLSSAVAALELVDGQGELRRIVRGDDDFGGVGVHLGALGVITSITLDIVPSFQIAQRVYLDLPYRRWQQHFDAITGAGYSVSVFTTWRGDHADQLWVKSLADQDEPVDTFGAVAADRPMHPIRTASAQNVTPQLGVPGPWHQRLPHFVPEFEPSGGAEIQSEFFVRRPDAPAAIEALRGIGEQLAPALQISEVRTMAADQGWLSPAHDQDGVGSVGFHFTWRNDQSLVEAHVPLVERALAPFSPRPHWGKVFSGTPRPIELYPQAQRFLDLAARLDPRGVFRNDSLDRQVFSGPAQSNSA